MPDTVGCRGVKRPFMHVEGVVGRLREHSKHQEQSFGCNPGVESLTYDIDSDFNRAPE